MVIPVASLMEVVSYILRPTSAYTLGKFVLSILCVLLAPTVFAMADYSLISRLMIKTGIHHPTFKPGSVRWIFLAADILSFFIQCGGGGLTASTNPDVSITGSKILLAGLSIALSVFVFFLFVLIYVHIQLLKRTDDTVEKKKDISNCKMLIYVLYLDMILLITRSVYRVAEYGNLQYRNSISQNENIFYALDATMMLALNFLWIPFHPGFWDMLDVDAPKSFSAVDQTLPASTQNGDPESIELNSNPTSAKNTDPESV